MISGTGSANVLTVAYTAPTAAADSNNAALQDITGNDALSIVTPRVIINHVFDAVAPTLSTASINAAGTEITLTYSEALDTLKTSAVSAFGVQISENGTTRSVGVSALRVQGSQVILTLSERVLSSTSGIQISYADPSAGNDEKALQDLAGNDTGAVTARNVVNNVDSIAPTVSRATFKDSKTLVLNFGEDLATETASAQAFSVTSGGANNAVTTVKVNGRTLELSLTRAIASGEATTWGYTAPAADRNMTNAAVQDISGNDMTSAASVAIDTSRATLQSASTNSTGNLLVLNFNEAMLSTNLPTVGSFQVLGSVSGLHTVNSLSVIGNDVSLVLSTSLLRNETVSWSYTAPADNIATSNATLQDLAGNDVQNLGTPQPLVATNKIAPVLSSKALAMNVSSDLKQLVLTFDDVITGTPSATSFTVGGTTQTVSAVHVSGKTVTLDLTGSLTDNASLPNSLAITVSYFPPSTDPLHDSAGNLVNTFSSAPVATLKLGTTGTDTLTGSTAIDYFLVSIGSDVLTGGGGADVFAWPSTTSNGTAVQTTIKDFGLTGGSGSLQGSAEADVLDLSHLLVGYSTATRSQYFQFAKNSVGKLVMSIDQDGGSSFSSTASVLFDNITVNAANNHLVVNGTNTAYIYSNDLSVSNNLLDLLLAESQLRLA